MKFLVVLSVAVACVAADVSHILKDESSAPILKSEYDISPEGAYQYAVETANGIYVQAQAGLVSQNSEYPYLAVKGAYKYTSPDGTPVEIQYVADENGYQPQGNVLPTPHPIPEAIARSLAYIAANPPSAVENGLRNTAYKAASILG